MNFSKKAIYWMMGVLTALSISAVAAYKISSGSIILGNGGSPETTTITSNQPGLNDPFIQYNHTTTRWEFTNDGSLVKAFGSGGGGGDGGINILSNSDAEDQLANFTASTPAQLTNVTGSSAVLEGTFSFSFDGAAQNDEVFSDEYTLNDGLIGKACEARIYYKTAATDYILEVLNGNDEVLGSLSLPAHSTADFESVFFLCPSQDEITLDANKGDLYVQLRVENVADPVAIVYDRLHLGSLIGLVEVAIPDVVSAKVGSSGIVNSESADWISGNCSEFSTGKYRCTFVPGVFSVTPACVANESGTSTGPHCDISDGADVLNSTEVVVTCDSTTTGSFISTEFEIMCQKQGVDAKQSVQVYKSIPKVADSFNSFGAYITNGGSATLVSQTSTFIQSVSRTGVGRVTVTWVPGLFTVAPAITAVATTTPYAAKVLTSTTTEATFATVNTSSLADVDQNFHIVVLRQSGDVKTPIVQPILVNQVETSDQGGVRVESCRIDNNGTATISTTDGSCAGWISSVNRSSIGRVDVTFVADTFSATPACTHSAFSGSANRITSTDNMVVSGMSVFTSVGSTAALIDNSFVLTCVGKR